MDKEEGGWPTEISPQLVNAGVEDEDDPDSDVRGNEKKWNDFREEIGCRGRNGTLVRSALSSVVPGQLAPVSDL